ncbi:unnamed protein product [Durusdinium trenchii]|uniref:Uncharacterized protein n=1 Tax=Durusdinium trenchii TaxID=1381693 RepID=A0ABP0QZE8_9DINO
MYIPPSSGPAVLRHPDDISSYASGHSAVPASAISANPWLTTPSLPPTREQGKVKDAAPTGVSRASIEAELPTEQSRMRAMRQVEADAPTMGPGVPGPYGAYGPAYGPAYGQAPSHSERSEPLEMPKLNLGNRSPRSASPRNGYESEFDRLIREKLEGQHTDRTHFKNRVQNRAQGHLSWQWQALDALLDGSLAMWEVRNLPLPTGERTVGEDVQGATVGRYDGRNCWSLWIVFFTPNFFQTTPLQTLVC